jgi:hypothetical protein
MNKSVLLIAVTIVFSLLVFVTAYSQEDMTHVENYYFENPQREPSVFPHEEHNEAAEIYECNQCHHVYENGQKLEYESSEDLLCSDCHELEAVNGQPSLLRAFHDNCKSCHLEREKGPIMCGECHVKR